MISFIYLFAFVLVISIVVIVHEGGHFFVARRCGVQVEEFSLGFGKELFGKVDSKGTRWKICALPLGGYVKMLGDEDPASAKSSVQKIPPKDRHKTFIAKKLWQRALIIFAGPATNYLLAFVLLVGLFWSVGMVVIPPVIGEVTPDSAAQKAGLQSGDEIVSINDRKIDSFTDIRRAIQLTEYGQPLTLLINRDNQVKQILVEPLWEKNNESPVLGVTSRIQEYQVKDNLNLLQSIQRSAQSIWTTTTDTLSYLGQIILGRRAPKDLRGPLGIAEASGDALLGGWIVMISFIANISVAIGLMNLLPIPALDGGHLALYLVEGIRRKPLSQKMQNLCLWLGLSLLLLIFAYSLLLDVPRILQRIFE